MLLPPERRSGIYAAYAFSRRADDSVDDGGSTARRLASVAARRDEVERCYDGDVPADDAVLVALADTVRRFAVPRAHLDALLDGVEMDLTVSRYPDFPALKRYCDRVAGAVGPGEPAHVRLRRPARPGRTRPTSAWPSRSSTSCATSPRMRRATASTCRPTRWRPTASARRT